jgi:acetyltransferase-like isoleucine patch superfamily enzyme
MWAGIAPVVSDLPAPAEAAPTAEPEPVRQRGGRISASPAARRLARERGLKLETIRGTGPRGEITRADIEAAAVTGAPANGRVDPEFLDLLRRDPNGFRGLTSEMKVRLYRQHGAAIGDHVRIEAGAILLAPEIVIGAASTIGADSIIECDRVRLGRLVSFGKRTRVKCRSIEIGDALWSKDDVVIGGGGSNEPGAHLRAGDACFFGEGAYLNPCHPVTLGDEVCIGSRAMLFTHSHWQSVLRGYSSQFGPIQIGDHVFIGNNAFVFPGVSVGAGATVMVNSFIALNVPPAAFVGGVPAQVIRHIATPSRVEQLGIMRAQMSELAAALATAGHTVTRREEEGGVLTLDLGGGAAVLLASSWPPETPLPGRHRTIVLSFNDQRQPDLRSHDTLFDLAGSCVYGIQDELSDEVREFCRRRGIRFRPFAWRHGVGHFEGERFCSRKSKRP